MLWTSAKPTVLPTTGFQYHACLNTVATGQLCVCSVRMLLHEFPSASEHVWKRLRVSPCVCVWVGPWGLLWTMLTGPLNSSLWRERESHWACAEDSMPFTWATDGFKTGKRDFHTHTCTDSYWRFSCLLPQTQKHTFAPSPQTQIHFKRFFFPTFSFLFLEAIQAVLPLRLKELTALFMCPFLASCLCKKAPLRQKNLLVYIQLYN